MFIKRNATFSSLGSSFYKADNPPFGATFTYYVKEAPKTTEKNNRKEKEKKHDRKRRAGILSKLGRFKKRR